MYFGGTGCTAASVSSGTSSQQNNNVSRVGSLPDHIFSGRSAHYRPDFHSFCHIGGMINLFHKARGQSNLIPVGGIAVSSAPHQLFLRQLALQRLRNGNRGVRRSRHTHGLIYITSSGKGISDRTAQTGSRPAERFYLCGMVVCLIFEKYQPFLRLLMVTVIHLHRNHHRTGINLIRLLHVRQLSLFFQLLHGHQRQIHQADELAPGMPLFRSVPVNLLTGIQITVISSLNGKAVIPLSELHILQLCGESCMTAVIGPVGIQHTDFRHTGIPLLVFSEILLNMLEILKRHSQGKRGVKLLQGLPAHPGKAFQHHHIRRLLIFRDQSIRPDLVGLPGIHRIDTVCFNS